MAATITTEARTWLTPAEVAARHDVNPITVRDWITDGIGVPAANPVGGAKSRVYLRAVRFGGRYRIEPADLAAFVARITTACAPADAAATAADDTPAAMKRRADASAKRLAGRL